MGHERHQLRVLHVVKSSIYRLYCANPHAGSNRADDRSLVCPPLHSNVHEMPRRLTTQTCNPRNGSPVCKRKKEATSAGVVGLDRRSVVYSSPAEMIPAKSHVPSQDVMAQSQARSSFCPEMMSVRGQPPPPPNCPMHRRRCKNEVVEDSGNEYRVSSITTASTA